MPAINHIRPKRLLIEQLYAAVEKHPEKEAVRIAEQKYSYSQLFESTSCLAAGLIQRGLKKGERVAIFMDNTWPCIVSIYATLMAGGVIVVINAQTKMRKLKFMLNDSDAKILLSDKTLEKNFLPIIENNHELNAVIVAGYSESKVVKDNLTLEAFDVVTKESESLTAAVNVIPTDLAALIYTSGSTGFPKGVMQTHQSIFFASWSLIEYLRLNSDERIMLVLPLAFDYGLYQLLMAINLGASLIVERSFAFPAKIYKQMEAVEATVFPAVPTIFAMMISAYKSEPFSFPAITKITNTAAALPADFVPWLHKIFPNALIFKMYGLTECKRVCYLEPEMVDKYPSSVGKAIPGTEVYLLSEEGKPVAINEPGILYVRGPHVMAGYWKQPKLSAEMLKSGLLPSEKVLCTHDLFRMDENGLLYFISRSDDIIKTRGEKVSPIEVENILLKLEGILEVAVIGVNDDTFGQTILAFIVLEENCELDIRKIKMYCSRNLEAFMVPKEIIFKDILPKSANGKIDKKFLASTL